ncbi:MAG: bifunctional riboflavin kinase/FAD synthetase, partial [Nitrospirae bacterium]
MKIITNLSEISGDNRDSVITLGNFDGLHLGHKRLINLVIDEAHKIGGRSVVFTFNPHPLKVLAPHRCPPLINILEQKIALFKDMGIELLVMPEFTKRIATMTPESFVVDVLHKLLRVKKIFIGANYRYGKDRMGNVKTLKEMGEIMGFDVEVVDYVTVNGEIISSTKIRELLKKGDVKHASKLLGSPYGIKGKIIIGDRRGRMLGFPTANIEPIHEIIPAPGVYATKINIDDRYYDAITNIGYRPTFKKNELSIE